MAKLEEIFMKENKSSKKHRKDNEKSCYRNHRLCAYLGKL